MLLGDNENDDRLPVQRSNVTLVHFGDYVVTKMYIKLILYEIKILAHLDGGKTQQVLNGSYAWLSFSRPCTVYRCHLSHSIRKIIALLSSNVL